MSPAMLELREQLDRQELLIKGKVHSADYQDVQAMEDLREACDRHLTQRKTLLKEYARAAEEKAIREAEVEL